MENGQHEKPTNSPLCLRATKTVIKTTLPVLRENHGLEKIHKLDRRNPLNGLSASHVMHNRQR